MWGSNSRPSDFLTRLWDWRAAYCANEAPAVLTFRCDIVTGFWFFFDIVTGCTLHVDWLSAKARYLAESATKKCDVFCDTQCRAMFDSNIMLKCLPSLLSARRSTVMLSYIQFVFVGILSHGRNFRHLFLNIIRRKPWSEPLDKTFYSNRIALCIIRQPKFCRIF